MNHALHQDLSWFWYSWMFTIDDSTATVRWPVDVWFNGSRDFRAVLDFGPRRAFERTTVRRMTAATTGGAGRRQPPVVTETRSTATHSFL